MNNRQLFKDKIVLDIGCGVGLLSLFAAKAGAKMVIAVEKSNVIEYAKRIIRANRYDNGQLNIGEEKSSEILLENFSDSCDQR